MKHRFLISKINELKYVSHLETVRMLERSFRRANLPLVFSQGFNPHANISSALPLSVGVESVYEVFEVDMEDFDISAFMNSQKRYLPQDLEILAIKKSEDKNSLMSKVAAAKYAIEIEDMMFNLPRFLEFTDAKSYMIKKINKKGKMREIDIRPLLLDFHIQENSIVVTLSSGSENNLNPVTLVESIYGDEFDGYNVKRLCIFRKENDTLLEMF